LLGQSGRISLNSTQFPEEEKKKMTMKRRRRSEGDQTRLQVELWLGRVAVWCGGPEKWQTKAEMGTMAEKER
jgi:hypothetical protein